MGRLNHSIGRCFDAVIVKVDDDVGPGARGGQCDAIFSSA